MIATSQSLFGWLFLSFFLSFFLFQIINPTLSKEVYQNYQEKISELDYKNENWNLPNITSVSNTIS